MIGLLLPLWLNLEGGGAPVPVHHDAPGERYLNCDPELRALRVESENRILAVDPERRELEA